MTCEEFEELSMKGIEKSIVPDFGRAEQSAIIKHLHECGACAEMCFQSFQRAAKSNPELTAAIAIKAMVDKADYLSAAQNDPELYREGM